jgi:hypothetical protein
MLKRILIVASAMAAGACGASDGVTSTDAIATAHITIANSATTAVVGQILNVHAIATNSSGGTVISAPLAFAVTGGGALSAATTVTDLNGSATLQWIIGPAIGQQVLTISSPGTSATATYAVTVTVASVAGTWVGATAAGQILSISLVENSGVVSGSGSLTGAGGPFAQTISGVFVAPTLTLTLSSGLHPPFNLQATLAGSTMTGALNGSGFANDAITLTKQ